MEREMGKIINIEALPSGWAALTWKQLVRVWELHAQMAGNRTRWHMEVLLYLTGLPALHKWRMEDGVLRVRFKGYEVTVTVEELEAWAFGSLAWMDEPYTLTALPAEFVGVGRTRYRLPQANLLSFTWQQYNNVQRIMVALWSMETRLEQLLRTVLPADEREAARVVEEIGAQVHGIEGDIIGLRAQFLAHTLLPPAFALTETKDRTTRLHPHRVYQYDVATAKRHAERLCKAPQWLFAIVYQVVQSSLGFYSKQFPDLFKSSGSGHKRRNELTAEVGTINAVMKYNGYRDQQDVYDSNAVFVFEILNTMTKEAEEVKKISKKKK